MTLTINQKDFSFSPDTLTAIGDKPYCNILIQPKEQFLLLKPNAENEKDVIDISRDSITGDGFITKLRRICGWSDNATITCEGELHPQGVLFKLKEATVTTPTNIFHSFWKKHSLRREKSQSFSCWDRFMGRRSSNESGRKE